MTERPDIKICGLGVNAPAVIGLRPDYVGFIFYKGSKRYFDGLPPDVPNGVKKVGVFVNPRKEEVLDKVRLFGLDVIQLHGEETASYCQEVQASLQGDGSQAPEIWKAFGVGPGFEFARLQPYLKTVDKFLLDTKGKERGGNGIRFDWTLLEGYPFELPIVLSGGIGPESVEDLKTLQQTDLPIAVIDINSRFELEPGFKNIQTLNTFIDELSR